MYTAFAHSNKMAREQKVCYPLPDGILMATIRANQLSLVNLGLDEKVMQLLEHLFITLQLLSCWRLARQGGETKLSMTDVGQLTGEKKKEKKKKKTADALGSTSIFNLPL